MPKPKGKKNVKRSAPQGKKPAAGSRGSLQSRSVVLLEQNQPFDKETWFFQVPLTQQKSVLQLVRTNMKPSYESSSWGWSDATKSQELFHRDSVLMLLYPRLSAEEIEKQQLQDKKKKKKKPDDDPFGLVAEEEQKLREDPRFAEASHYWGIEPAAMLHVRFEEYEGRACLYVYELQVDKKQQGKGLGEKIMTLAHGVSEGLGRAIACLTVFKANEGAIRFYRRFGYSADQSDPEVNGNDEEYYVLSKKIGPEDRLRLEKLQHKSGKEVEEEGEEAKEEEP